MTTSVTTQGTLAAAVPDGGTFVVSYPSRSAPDSSFLDEGTFYGAMGHQLVMNQATLTYPAKFDIAFGTANITVTNRTGATWPAGSPYVLDLARPGKPIYFNTGRTVNRASRADTVLITLGAPDTSDAAAIMASQSVAAGGSGLLNGTVGATLDTPRALVGAWTGAAIATVTGQDEYGNTIVEASASGTAFTGKKAFRKITSIKFSAAVTAATFGTTDIIGVPVFLGGTAYVLKELQDGVPATAGTIVAGLRGASTSASGDVRGTYKPNAAADGDKVFQLLVALPDPQFLGTAQFTG